MNEHVLRAERTDAGSIVCERPPWCRYDHHLSRKAHVSATAQSEMRTPLPPVKATQNRDAYFPGTEDLGPNEMRVISLGTAMPYQRPTQAAPSFLVELGNGDKFQFDIGTG